MHILNHSLIRFGINSKCRDRICKLLWSPGIDYAESISPAYVAWRAGAKNRVVVPARQVGNRFLGSLKGLQIRAQYLWSDIIKPPTTFPFVFVPTLLSYVGVRYVLFHHSILDIKKANDFERKKIGSCPKWQRT